MNQNKNQKIRIVEIVIILLIVGVCAGIFVWQKLYQKPALYAEIYQNDQLVEKISLSDTEDKILTLDEQGRVHVEIKDHQIRFYQVDCPDKICEHTGWLSKSGDRAVCMPNRFYIQLSGEDKT